MGNILRNQPTSGQPQGSSSLAVARPSGNASVFSRVINWGLALLIFATPLLFLPFTAEVREFNKLSFVFLTVMVMLGVWVVKILTTRKVSWVKTPLDFVLLGYIVIYLLASFFSLDQPSSFLGYYGRFVGSFLSVMSFVVLYYIVVNNVRTKNVVNKLTDVLLVSGFLVLLYSLLQMFGVYVLPFDFAKATSFNPVGSLAGLAVFSVLMVLLAQWKWLIHPGPVIRRLFYVLATVAGLLVIFLVNSFIAWVVLALGMILFIALSTVITEDQQASQSYIWKPLLVLVIAVLFVGFNFLPREINPRSWVGSMVNIPVEIQLSNSATWEMVKNALSEKPILGFGPGTTGIAFGQIKPESLNQSVVWSLNFDRASSEIANIAIETGLLGVLVFEGVSILFILYAIFFLLRRADHPGRSHAFGVFTVWAALYATHFFYFYNTTLYLLFWFLLALFVAITHWSDTAGESQNLSMNESPRSALSWMFASLLVLAVLLIGGFFQIAVYFSDVAYASGIKELNKEQPDLTRAHNLFADAIQRNPYRDVYFLAYGQNIVFQSAQEVRKEQPDTAKLQRYITELIGAGNSATALSPNKASNWSTRSQFYSQIRALAVPGTDDLIVSSAEEAVKKDSRNPVLQLQLAQAYYNAAETIDAKMVSEGQDTDADGLSNANEEALKSNLQDSDSNDNGVSDGDEVKAGYNPAGTGRLTSSQMQKFTRIDQDKLRKAEESLKKAIELKNNLPDSYIALMRVYEKWNKLEDGKKILEEGVKILPNNADLKYELGRVTFNLKDYSGAESLFNDVIKLVPDHANAHYSLGLVAVQKGDLNKALAEFERTLKITGSNAELEQLITSVKNQIQQQPAQ
ncbi:MAG TPA: tetratricopeptide repeat protein [Candidatus Binatia bacterium]|nr:tetratricopeptide repeat protein [Candidatus Binatia bacterium]